MMDSRTLVLGLKLYYSGKLLFIINNSIEAVIIDVEAFMKQPGNWLLSRFFLFIYGELYETDWYISDQKFGQWKTILR